MSPVSPRTSSSTLSEGSIGGAAQGRRVGDGDGYHKGTVRSQKEVLWGEQGQGRGIDCDEEIRAEEDIEQINTLPAPDLPTQAEVEEHRVTHLPYRSWCDDCVEAMAREFGHSAID